MTLSIIRHFHFPKIPWPSSKLNSSHNATHFQKLKFPDPPQLDIFLKCLSPYFRGGGGRGGGGVHAMSSDFILQIIFWRNTVDVYTISHKENLVVNPNLQIMSNKFPWILSNLLLLLGITLFYKCHDTFWTILQSYVQLHCPNNRYWTYITIYPLQCYNNGTFIESIYFFTSVLGSLCHKRNYISIPWKNTRL